MKHVPFWQKNNIFDWNYKFLLFQIFMIERLWKWSAYIRSIELTIINAIFYCYALY